MNAALSPSDFPAPTIGTAQTVEPVKRERSKPRRFRLTKEEYRKEIADYQEAVSLLQAEVKFLRRVVWLSFAAIFAAACLIGWLV